MGFYSNIQKKKEEDELQKLLSSINRKEERLDDAGIDYGGLLKKFTKPAASLFDLLQRGQYVSAETASNLAQGELPTLQELASAAKGETKKSYSDVLGEVGMQPGLARSALGFAGDIFLDPLTYIPVGGWLAKGAGKGVKAGTKLPGIAGKSFSKVDDAAKFMSNARKVKVLENAGKSEAQSLLRGPTGRFGYEMYEHLNDEVGKPMVDTLEKAFKEGYDGQKIAAALEDKALRATLSDGELGTVKTLEKYLQKTGEQKVDMGTIEGMIGIAKERAQTFQVPLPFDNLDAATKPVMDDYILGNILKVNSTVEDMGYLPHFVTDEFKKLRQINGTPEEQMRILAGLNPTALPSKEKPRNYMQFAQEMNDWSMEKLGVKMFEDDIYKIMPRYVQAHVRNKSLWDLTEELKGITDDAGEKLIQHEQAFIDPEIGKVVIPVGKTRLDKWPFEGLVADTDIAKEMTKVVGVMNSDDAMNAFTQGMDKTLSAWRQLVTVYGPNAVRFNLNNLIGAQFNNFLERGPGVFKELPEAIKLSRKKIEDMPFMIRAGERSINSKEFKREMAKRGLLLTRTAYEVGADTSSTRSLAKLIKGGGRVKKELGDVSSNIEAIVRNTLALDLWKNGSSWDEIAREVTKVHGNYSPEFYNQLEKGVLSRAFPFYKWMRTNIPFQLEKIVMNTGRYAVLPKLQSSMMQGVDTENMPDWLKTQTVMGAPEDIGNGQMAAKYMRLPTQDLLSMIPGGLSGSEENTGGITEMMSSLNPMIKAPIEFGTNRELFTGRDISDKDAAKAGVDKVTARPLAEFPLLKQLLGTETTPYRYNEDAPLEDRREADAKRLWLLRQLPVLSALYYNSGEAERVIKSQGEKWDESSVGKKFMQQAIAALDPRRTAVYDPESEKYFNQKELETLLQELINYNLKRDRMEYSD